MEGENKKDEVIFKRKNIHLVRLFIFLFIGLWASIINIALGIVYCCTLIFIPFGIAYFKSIPLVAFPQDKVVVTHFEYYPFKNPFWLLFRGIVDWFFNRIAVDVLYLFVVIIIIAK